MPSQWKSKSLDRSAGALAGCRGGASPPHPDPLPFPQISLRRIFEHIFHRPLELPFVSKQMIKVFPLPESSASPKNSIRRLRRERFPGVQDFGKIVRREDSYNHMHMVRHDAPGEQTVLLLIKEQQSFRNHLRDFANAQGTGTRSKIKILLDPDGAKPLQMQVFAWSKCT